LLIASQAAWAIYILYGKPLVAHRPPILILAGSHLFALVSLWPISLPIGGWDFVWEAATWAPGVWLGILYLGLVNTGFSQLLFMFALREVTSAQAVSYTYLQPPMTAVLAMLFLNEQPTVMTLLCGGVILVGIWLVNRPRTVRRPLALPEPVVTARPVQR
jgi:drug/metabolite transporter (DMT)-like permease